SYDDQRVVGASNWTNTARSFDAVKLGYADKQFAFDVFASSVVVIQDDHFDRHLDGNNFYGVHTGFFSIVRNSELDAYVFWKTAPFVVDERLHTGDADTVTFGARLA